MRIVLVSHYFPSHRGGVEIVAGRLATELHAQGGLSIDWFASDCDGPPDQAEGFTPKPVRTWNVVERTTGLPYPLWAFGGLRRLHAAIRESDIVHLHDFIYMGSLCAFLLARRHHKPVVITQHLGVTPYERRWMRIALGFVNRFVGTKVLGAADRVVFISDAARRFFTGLAAFRHSPQHWPNGVDSSVFKALPDDERESIRTELGLPAGQPTLLFVGRFVEHKGLELLREVCGKTPGSAWLFAGWGAIDPESWGLPNVRVFRGLGGASLARLYQAADLLVLPSREGGFPLVVQEAMACGTPALVSEATLAGSPRSRSLVETEPLSGADCAERWAEKIGTLLGSPALARERREEIARFAHREWSWSVCAGKYRALFDELTAQSRVRSS